jgi:uncharacterized DUF497 family protein
MPTICFIWDTQIAIINFEKHGVSFEDAAKVFTDEDGLDWEDRNHSQLELRRKRLGELVEGRILLTVYTGMGIEKWQRQNQDHQLKASEPQRAEDICRIVRLTIRIFPSQPTRNCASGSS